MGMEIRQGCHKTVYHDYATAMRRVKRSVIYKNAYFCGKCDGWHLTRDKAVADSPESVAEKCREAAGVMRLAREILGR
jgi:hypothetical protein